MNDPLGITRTPDRPGPGFGNGHLDARLGLDLEPAAHQERTLPHAPDAGGGARYAFRLESATVVEDGTVELRRSGVELPDQAARVPQGLGEPVEVPGGKAVFPTLTVRENLVTATEVQIAAEGGSVRMSAEELAAHHHHQHSTNV